MADDITPTDPIVRGNPLQDVRALETGVVFVMKDGVVHRQP